MRAIETNGGKRSIVGLAGLGLFVTLTVGCAEGSEGARERGVMCDATGACHVSRGPDPQSPLPTTENSCSPEFQSICGDSTERRLDEVERELCELRDRTPEDRWRAVYC
jgi:hypothetical protein